MTRLNLVLGLLLLLSAVWLVRSSHEARTLFVALERAQAQERELQVDFERLKVERRTAATPLVVENMVRQKLRMSSASPGVTHYVSEGQPMSSAGGARPPAGAASPVLEAQP